MSVLYVGASEISPILDVTQNQKTFNILEYKQSDHILNDIRWLRANTNSWQSGEMYESAYAALVEYKRTATLKSHTINNITIPYYLAENGFKIVVAEQAENVDNLYNTQGFADYFILDTDNKQFKLPRRSNRRIIKSQKASKDNNYSWYNIYSDGWVEQGGKVSTVENSAVDIRFPVEMGDADQYLFHGNATHEFALNTASLYLKTITHSATGVSVVGVANMGATTIYQVMEFEWEVLGAAAESEYVDLDDVLYDYYYVGEFEQTALMQTAGIVSEQLNGLDKYIDDKVAESISDATGLPEQEGHAGKFLTTDGTNTSWVEIQQESNPESEITAAGAPLLTSIWSDHLLKDASWRRADDFEWHDGRLYTAAYKHLADDCENAESETLYAWDNGVGYCFYTLSESPSAGDSVYDSLGIVDDSYFIINVEDSGIYIGEDEVTSLLYTRDSSRDTKFLPTDTIGDITIRYTLAEDGHKICQPDQESNLATLYENTGAAWYYLIDPINERFKLPRTKWGFTGLRDSVGGYVEAGLPNITGTHSNGYGSYMSKTATGAFYWSGAAGVQARGEGGSGYNIVNIDASRSNSIYGKSSTVQPPATQMYLYFYVGNFEQQTEEEINDLLDTVDDKFYSKMTDCITHIPQDIKLEMSDDEKLTIKAGSKVYIPNGPGVFDSVVIPNDITVGGWGSLTGIIIISSGGTGASFTGLSQVYSGATEPTISSGNVWYDTENNMVKRSSDGSSWGTIKHSLPIAIVTANNSTPNGASGIASIDQVFNGFGYIGSTAFALPGVKGLSPYGRNSDGTLKSLEVNVKNVLTTTDVSGATGGLWYTLNSNAITRVNFGVFTYDKEKNKYRDNSSGSYNNTFVLIDSSAYRKDGKVEKFNPIMPLSITDRSNTDFIATQAMPSDKYIDLKLGATDSYYTAPADGYFFVAKTGDINQFLNGYITPNNSTTRIIGTSRMASVNGTVLVLFLPVSKGQRLFLTYTATGDTTYFKFIYANGSK